MCLLILGAASKQLTFGTGLMTEFSADAYCKVLHSHTQGHPPGLLEVTQGLSLVIGCTNRF